MPVADSVPEVSGPGISNVPAMPQGVPSTNGGLRPVYTKVPVFQPWATSHVDTFRDLAQQLQSNNFSKRASPTERAERHRIEGLMQAARNSEGNIIDTQPAARAAARPAALNVTGLPPRAPGNMDSPTNTRGSAVNSILNAVRRSPR